MECQINSIVFLVGVGFYKLEFEMMKVGVECFEEREFFHGFPKVLEDLVFRIQVSDTAKYVVVGLRNFSVVAAGVWTKQEFYHIFFDFFMRNYESVLSHGCGYTDIVGGSCRSKRFVSHCRWGESKSSHHRG